MRWLITGSVCVAMLCSGCGAKQASEALPAASAPALDLAAMRALKPADAAGGKAFDDAFAELEKDGGSTGFHAIGELAFHTSTIPALCYLMEHGDPKAVRLAFSGLRAVMDGTASMSWTTKLKLDLDRYRETALPVLARPEHLRQIRAGLGRLGSPGQSAFGGAVDAIK